MASAAGSAGRLTPRRVTIKVGGVAALESAEVESPMDLKALIIRAAEKSGLRRFDVKINGKVVKPNEIDKAFEGEGDLVVELIPADVAASWRVERIEDYRRLLKFR